MNRVDKNNYYLDIADTVAERGTCLRRNFGAIIVKNDEMINRLCRCAEGQSELFRPRIYTREKLKIPRGER